MTFPWSEPTSQASSFKTYGCDNVSKAFTAMPLPLCGPILDFLCNRGCEQQSCVKAGTRWFILVWCLRRKHIVFIYMFCWLEVALGRLLESAKGLKALTIFPNLVRVANISKFVEIYLIRLSWYRRLKFKNFTGSMKGMIENILVSFQLIEFHWFFFFFNLNRRVEHEQECHCYLISHLLIPVEVLCLTTAFTQVTYVNWWL